MTCNFKVRLDSQWVLEHGGGERLALGETVRLLGAIEATGHIAGACRVCGVSYRHAWGVLRHAEEEFGTALLETGRRKGTKLTPFGQRLLWADRRAAARLVPTFESMASELQEELESFCPDVHPRLHLHASHGFAVEGMMNVANQLPSPLLELRYRTATEALASLQRGECDLAGFEVPEGEFEAPFLRQYAEWLDPARHCLIHLAVRSIGMFVQPDNPKNIHSLVDLTKPNVRFVNRQFGSSTRYLVGLMLRKLGVESSQIRGFDSSEFTHMAIAAHVVSGMADVGIGVETAAWRSGLSFIPLVKERYFFAIQRDRLSTPLMDELFALIYGDTYQNYLSDLVGYDATFAGRVQTLEEAFGADFTMARRA